MNHTVEKPPGTLNLMSFLLKGSNVELKDWNLLIVMAQYHSHHNHRTSYSVAHGLPSIGSVAVLIRSMIFLKQLKNKNISCFLGFLSKIWSEKH